MQSMNDIRAAFLGYFADKDHQLVPSSPVVPQNDPTLLFTNAGMVPFKNVFTGIEQRSYSRAASAQKCIRAGGKHNDLDNVGYTARHHTFFEMLGNFSFGDYFKEEAIFFAWDFLTKELAINPSKLLVTVYGEDEDAAKLWKKITGLDDSRIIRISTSDNFWSMGDTGPCGPCSEIFYDHGEDVFGGPPGSADEDGDRFVEIWNLVFMQFDQQKNGKRTALPKPSIDTGMGLERVTAVLQGVHNNYDTDLFRHLIAASHEVTGTGADKEHQASHRVIADHLRSCSFMMADGVMASNEGRGYVLRRIMRRAMRHANLLGAKEPIMHRLVPALVSQMGSAYPELSEAQDQITQNFLDEEERFLRTLDRGMNLLNAEVENLRAGGILSGDVAFKLYDTYGFPLDLTADALRERDISVDTKRFTACMQVQKDKARAAWKGSGDVGANAIWTGLMNKIPATKFIGYEDVSTPGTLLALVIDGEQAQTAQKGQSVEMAFDQTPFYGESGGQAGDIGIINFIDGGIVDVHETGKIGALHVLRGEVRGASIQVGENAVLHVDVLARKRTSQNHSATHLLHAALRRRLGAGVVQKGSYVGPDRLRFDFSNSKAVSKDDLVAIAQEVNEIIWQNHRVTTKIMSPDAARKSGAMALFGEKYGDEVRVLQMGQAPEDCEKPYSIELCGGTHVKRTGDIGLVRILGESAVAAGIRRIEALSGEAARQSYEQDVQVLSLAATSLKTTPVKLVERLDALVAQNKQIGKDISQMKRQLAMGGTSGDVAIEKIGDISFMGRILDGVGGKDLLDLVDQSKSKLDGEGVIVLIGVNEGKASLCVGVTSKLSQQISAVDLVRSAAVIVGGKGGGGRPDRAQAGGPDGEKSEAAIQEIRNTIESIW